MPSAALPDRRRPSVNAVRMADDLVSCRSIFTAASKPSASWSAPSRPPQTLASWSAPSRPPPNPRQHGRRPHGRLQTRPSRASISFADAGPQPPDRYCSGCPRPSPVPLDRIEDFPRQLDFLVSREQRRIPEEHIKQQPLVCLGARLGERLAVREVHVDVANFHRGARHLRAKSDRHTLVWLDPNHQRVLAPAPRLRWPRTADAAHVEKPTRPRSPVVRDACRPADRTDRRPIRRVSISSLIAA